jgi:HlyD family secretion protein
MGKRAALIPVLLVALAALLFWRVRVDDARRKGPTSGSTTVEGTATVVASKIAGRLVELGVREGDRVQAGQVVGGLECSDQQAALGAAQARLAAARAQREAANAAVAQAQRSAGVADAQIGVARAQEQVLAVDQARADKDLGRTTRLHEAGAVSDSLYDDEASRAENLLRQRSLAVATERTAQASSAASQAAIRTAALEVAAADAQIEAARSDVTRAQLASDECRLTAPRDGFVTERFHEPGAVLPAGAPVLTVLDLSTVKAIFFVPDAELGRVAVGAPAELRVDAYPGRVFSGRVRRIASEAEFTPRDVQTREDRDRLVYAVEIEVANGDGALRAGMPGDVTLPGTDGGVAAPAARRAEAAR